MQRETLPLDGLRAKLGCSAEIDYARGYVGDVTGEYNGVETGQNLKDNRSADQLIAEAVEKMLDDIQNNIFEKARKYRDAHIYECDNYEEFKERVKDGGFFLCHWDGTAETEAKIKEETQATIRCVPFAYEQTPGVDMVSGKPAVARVIIARSY